MAPKHCFLITIDNVDQQGATNRLARDVEGLVEGREPEPSDPSIFNRWVLKGTEVDVQVWVGINKNVSGAVRNTINQALTLVVPMEFGPEDVTREFMIARLRQQMREQGAELAYRLQPGQSVPNESGAALLARFTESLL